MLENFEKTRQSCFYFHSFLVLFYFSFSLQKIYFFVILSFQVNTINYYYREIILTVINMLLFANPRAISRIILSKGENLLRAILFFIRFIVKNVITILKIVSSLIDIQLRHAVRHTFRD